MKDVAGLLMLANMDERPTACTSLILGKNVYGRVDLMNRVKISLSSAAAGAGGEARRQPRNSDGAVQGQERLGASELRRQPVPEIVRARAEIEIAFSTLRILREASDGWKLLTRRRKRSDALPERVWLRKRVPGYSS
ncbi:hypothetical protein ACLOJK_033319 [Asimina triloba]